MQQVKKKKKQWLLMIKMFEICMWPKEVKNCHHPPSKTKILFKGLSVMCRCQCFFKLENLFWCFGNFQSLAVSLLTRLSGFPRGSYLQAAAVADGAAKQVQWLHSCLGAGGQPGWAPQLSPFKACRLWPVNRCLHTGSNLSHKYALAEVVMPYYLA